ncbi:hypothetical protein CBP35_12500 [Acidovorax carolinensis]|nr:hypothetical protein CBP35_12500 [Acidovorax carolinensis]
MFDNPISLFIGGVAAVLLELAEPSVRTGVWDHSSFQRDPLLRLRRTGFAAMVTVYAPADQAEQLIARVVHMHDRVRGITPDGQRYHANDTRLLDWVQATASFGFCEAYHRYARPLSHAEKSQVFAEGSGPPGCMAQPARPAVGRSGSNCWRRPHRGWRTAASWANSCRSWRTRPSCRGRCGRCSACWCAPRWT